MSAQFWLGLAVVPAVAVVVAAVLFCSALASAVARRWLPQHWVLDGPQRRPREPAEIFRWVNVAGRHVAGFRRLAGVGPWTVYVARYKPGQVPECDLERTT